MIARLLLGIALVFAVPAAAQDTAEPPALAVLDSAQVTPEEFLWTARPIVVFADSPADPRFAEQLRFLETDAAGLIARDVVIVVDTVPSPKSAWREALRPRGFALVLIDKDGQVKLRKPAPWTVREITRSIDKWPTRQQEIRETLGKE